MNLSVVAVVATIAAGVSVLVAVAAVFAARRSTAHADLALKEASRISRASISRINEVQSEASSARLAARHAAERLRSMTKERTTPDSVAAYRVFLREVVEDSKHLLGPEGTGTMKNEALDRLRVGALVGGSDEVLRAMRNFALLRTQRPEAPWPSAYAMAYARLESDLVTAIRNDLGFSEESLTADQIWGAVNARCVDPAFRLALLSPLEDVLRNAGQDPTHYDLDHIVKFADYPSPTSSTGAARTTAATGATGSTRAVPAAGGAGTSGSEPRRRSRRADSRVTRKASAAPSEPAPAALSDSDIVWPPLTPGRRGGRAAAPAGPTTVPEPARPTVPAALTTATTMANTTVPHEPVLEPTPSASAPAGRPSGVEPSPTAAAALPLALQPDAPSGPSTASLPDVPSQAAGTQQAPPAETSAHHVQSPQSPESPTSHRAPETHRGVFEAPTPSRISRRRRTQAALTGSSIQAAAAPDAVPGTATAPPLAASVVPTSGESTASANTEETEPVLASTPPGAPTGHHTTEAPMSVVAPAAAVSAAQARPQPAQPHPERTRPQAGSPPARQDVPPERATAVSVQTVAVATGAQPSPVAPAAAGPTAAADPVGVSGYGFLPPQGAPQAPAKAPGSTSHPVYDQSDPSILTASQQADQSSAVTAAGAVPADAVGSHRAAAVMVSTAGTVAPADPGQAADPAMPETTTIPTNPSAAMTIPTATAWSSTPPSLQDSGRFPRARGA